MRKAKSSVEWRGNRLIVIVPWAGADAIDTSAAPIGTVGQPTRRSPAFICYAFIGRNCGNS